MILYGKTDERQYDGDGHVSRHYFIIVKFAHLSFITFHLSLFTYIIQELE